MKFNEVKISTYNSKVDSVMQQKIANLRIVSAMMYTHAWVIVGHLLNLLVFKDIPAADKLQSHKLAANTIFRIRCEQYCHDYKKPLFQP